MNPRNDPTLLEWLGAGHDDCTSCGPSWWDGPRRGCYERAKENYASGRARVPDREENRTERRMIYGPETSPRRGI